MRRAEAEHLAALTILEHLLGVMQPDLIVRDAREMAERTSSAVLDAIGFDQLLAGGSEDA